MASTVWSREGQHFPVHRVNTTLPSIYKCVIMLDLKEVVLLRGSLHSCPILEYLTYSLVSLLTNCAFVNTDKPSSSRFVSLDPARSFIISSERSFREGFPRELVHSPSYLQLALNLGRVLSLLTVRPSEYYSSQICIAALRIGSSFVFLDCRLCE